MRSLCVCVLPILGLFAPPNVPVSAFSLSSFTSPNHHHHHRHHNKRPIRYRRNHRLSVSRTPTTEDLSETAATINNNGDPQLEDLLLVDIQDVSVSSTGLLQTIQEKVGAVEDERFIFPEYISGDVPRMFSSIQYKEGKAVHAAGSVLSAAALIAGTTVGAGVLALPTTAAVAGFVPSSFALISAWVYMTMSGLLIAELTINHMGTGSTGRPGMGLLALYKSSLGGPLSIVGSAAYFFLHYAMMVAYIAQGGVEIDNLLGTIGADGLLAVPGLGQATFAAACGLFLYATRSAVVEKVNNVLVLGVAAAFLGIVGIGAQTADFASLIDPVNQHPTEVVNCLPILFLALVYQNVVPTIVSQLEGDRSKITKAIFAGTTAPLLMFLAWNGVVLGNMNADLVGMDPVAMLEHVSSAGSVLGPLVSAFSSLALVTSVIGFTYGLIDAWTDVFKIDTQTLEFDADKKLLLFALVFGPPLALSTTNPDIFYKALEYGGAFGVSTLFLFLPPVMVWRERYGDDAKPLVAKPMVPLGKVALGSMYKIAATLVLEQGAEKLGVFDFLKEHWLL